MAAHGGKISRRDGFVAPDGRSRACGEVLALDVDGIVRAGFQGNCIRNAHGGNAVDALYVSEDCFFHAQGAFIVVFDLGRGNGDAQGLDFVRGGEAGIDMTKRLEGAQHQTGADQQDQREGHLNDHEKAARPALRLVLAERPSAVRERVRKLRTRVFQSGD